MLRRPPDGRVGAAANPKTILTWALLLAASCVSITDAHGGGSNGGSEAVRPIARQVADDHLDDVIRAVRPATIQHGSPSSPKRRRSNTNNNDKNDIDERQNIVIPNDASAPATLAPGKPVRAPSAGLRPHSAASGAGVASPRSARNLADWEVEDLVLLATVNGDLYGFDRKTGKKRWKYPFGPPLVETEHVITSGLDELDRHPVDQYIWAIEPTGEGAIYIWVPGDGGPNSVPTLSYTGQTMKRLVEELAPHETSDPPVAYLGSKASSIYTFDLDTGNVIRTLGTTGHWIDENSCLRPNAIRGQDECVAKRTVRLGRTEYTVSVRGLDGRTLVTLKYNDWNLNTFDKDLLDQYHIPLDQQYIIGGHDKSPVAYLSELNNKGQLKARVKLDYQDTPFESAVARAFDLYRPRDSDDPNGPFIVLPQPPPLVSNTAANELSNLVLLNCTQPKAGEEGGNWYALSGLIYPQAADAAVAKIERPEFWNVRERASSLTGDEKIKYLAGTHHLDVVGQPQNEHLALPAPSYSAATRSSLPAPTSPADEMPGMPTKEKINETLVPEIGDGLPPTIGSKIRSLPQVAADKVTAFAMNEVTIFIFMVAFFYYQNELRRKARRWVNRWSSTVTDAGWFSHSSNVVEDSDSETDEKPAATVPTRAEAEALGLVREAPELPEKADISHDDEETPVESENEARVSSVEPAAVAAAAAPIETLRETKHDEDKATAKDTPSPTSSDATNMAPAEGQQKKKKAHRGRRGGVKHRKGPKREASESRDDDQANGTVEETVGKVKNFRFGEQEAMEPDVQTVNDDMQSVSGSVLKIGNIEVDTDNQLGTGSNGTIVFAGKFDGRVVAVKRMLIQFYDIASQETRLLRESDNHPNGRHFVITLCSPPFFIRAAQVLTQIVIRYFAQQSRDGFLYIALERCVASLADVVEKPRSFPEIADAGKRDLPDVLLQIANGINYLHSLRIVHRDLKPQNILVNMVDGKPRLLVSDFGLCKKLEGGQSSFGATTGRAAGTTGWRAPELLLDDDSGAAATAESLHSGSGSVVVNDHMVANRRATRSIDIFSLGLVFFYVLTNGSHPFDCGDRYMREVNIRKGTYSLELLSSLGEFAYEAQDLITSMLSANPRHRPSAKEVMAHPFFWDPKKRLDFLVDTSDAFEREPRDPPSDALANLESYGPYIIKNKDFLKSLPKEFVESLGKQRKYTGSRMLDLLRALRNKKNHYQDMSDHLKSVTGPLPDGYLGFWTRKFPDLLITCWNVVYNEGWHEKDEFRRCYEPARWAP